MYVYSWGENAVIANAFVEVIGLVTCHDDVIVHATELPVFCQLTLKRLGLVPYQFSNEYR